MLSLRRITLTAAALWCAVFADVSFGVAYVHGDFGPDAPGIVKYLNVNESSGTDPGAVPLYGTPTITGNTLDFDPAGFVAFAPSGGSMVDITDGQLNYTIESTNDLLAIHDITHAEGGDFTLFGVGTAATQVAAGLFVDITILEVDGLAITPFSTSGSVSLTKNLVANPGLNQPWGLSLLIDLDSALTAANVSYLYGVTKAEVVVDNTLIALSESQTVAMIAKKNFTIYPTVSVPEPASLVLLGLGVLSIVRRRPPVSAD